MENIIKNALNLNVNKTIIKIKKRLNNHYRKLDRKGIENKKTLSHYNLIKPYWEYAYYLNLLDNKEGLGLTWLRMGCWKLRNFRGGVMNGVCILCNKEQNTYCSSVKLLKPITKYFEEVITDKIYKDACAELIKSNNIDETKENRQIPIYSKKLHYV